MKKVLLDNSIDEIKEIMTELNEPSFRAKQIFSELTLGKSFNDMTALPKTLRTKLSQDFQAQPTRIVQTLVSKDGTEKYLFNLADGNVIEGVLMKYKYGNTQCVSTQVGCRMNCAFCASGLGGLVRNLSAGEILSQIVTVNAKEGGTLNKRAVTNVVLMGSGEPLDNYENVVKFIRNVSSKDGLNISPRNISLSTCGLVPNIYKLAEEGLPINLTISLHSPFDSERAEIMPIAKKYSIEEILDACAYYFEKTGRRYIFEYVLILGKNDEERHANELIRLLKGSPCHVNLIRLNEVKERGLNSVTDKNAYRFLGLLEKGGLSATVRRRTGDDIEGACGQLRRKVTGEKF